ncbi:MAG: biopolymer transporter ExbD [Cetobacterium sp.]|uniref:ExbD/TolR family protein n=1 Tax=unclassified Cetobacterium TaxID=2630983 RepID=UPI00163C9513|nr:biopolymer transporter ExbD [Cetobacterium sp. 2A]MBC2856632.1 biopolymer transporter ExbD [Cetobacterium sp. 2A]
MKLNRIKRRSGAPLILELTPLIDVVFLLLIFFLVATSFEDVRDGIKIDLPQSTIKESKDIKELQVIVSKSKEYYISYKEKGKTEKVKVTKKDLKEQLKERLDKSETKNVVISADKSLDHGTIVDLMTMSKEAGASSLDIDTTSSK